MDKFIIESKEPMELTVVEEPQTLQAFMFTDGACRGNGKKTSESGAGIVLFDENRVVIEEISEYLGRGLTNNISEYKALIIGLKRAIELGIKRIKIYVDSKLVCEQVSGNWKINNIVLKVLCTEIWKLKLQFDEFEITAVLRHLNKHADRLANIAVDKGAKPLPKQLKLDSFFS